MHDWVYSPSTGNIGHSGGLILNWNKNTVNITSHEIHQNWIWIRGNMVDKPLVKLKLDKYLCSLPQTTKRATLGRFTEGNRLARQGSDTAIWRF